MCYQNGKKILPPPLLSAIQEYIDGEYIYIPRKTNNKRPWGSTKGTKQQTAERNQEIFCRYLSGIPVTVLAEEYFLSSKTIYSIIAKKKILSLRTSLPDVLFFFSEKNAGSNFVKPVI